MNCKNFVITLSLFFLLTPLAFSAVGVSPSYYDVNFKSGLNEEFTFNFFTDNGRSLNFEVNGDLSDYAKIKSQKNLGNGKIEVIVELALPQVISIPGLHVLQVSGLEEGSVGGVSLNLNVKGLIRIRVPYPAKYAEIDLDVQTTNQGEDLPYTLTVYSRGEEDIFVEPVLELRTLEGTLIDEILLESQSIKSTENVIYTGNISTKTYSPGDYYLNAVVDYESGKTVNQTVLVRLGELKINILNYTSTFEKNKLNHFNIDIESVWNDPIEGVHAEVSVIGYPLKGFSTPSLDLAPWGTQRLSGVLDTNEIEDDSLQLKINVIYAEKTTSQIVNISREEKVNWTLIFILVGAAGLIAVIIFLVLYISKLKNGKNKS